MHTDRAMRAAILAQPIENWNVQCFGTSVQLVHFYLAPATCKFLQYKFFMRLRLRWPTLATLSLTSFLVLRWYHTSYGTTLALALRSPSLIERGFNNSVSHPGPGDAIDGGGTSNPASMMPAAPATAPSPQRSVGARRPADTNSDVAELEAAVVTRLVNVGPRRKKNWCFFPCKSA